MTTPIPITTDPAVPPGELWMVQRDQTTYPYVTRVYRLDAAGAVWRAEIADHFLVSDESSPPAVWQRLTEPFPPVDPEEKFSPEPKWPDGGPA